MGRGGIIVAAACLVIVVGFAGYLTLQACALALPGWLAGVSSCKAPAQLAAEARLAALKDRNAELLREVLYSERELAQMQCTAQYEVAVLPPPVAEPEPASPPAPENAIDEDAWRAQDVSMLEGCWELDSDYRVENIRTRAITHYTQWTMCFDRSGRGDESMTATNGIKCEGPVGGRFDSAGQLAIEEDGNLHCTDGSYIFKRDLTCVLSGGGSASCGVFQPELGRKSTVQLRRSIVRP